MLDPAIDFLVYAIFVVGGLLLMTFFIESYFHFFPQKKANHFTLVKYLLYIFFPTLGLVYFTYALGIEVLWFYLFSCLLGALGEWIAGYTYHKITGQRLWSYHKFLIGRYTSLLSTPLWGFCALVFWFLGRIVFA